VTRIRASSDRPSGPGVRACPAEGPVGGSWRRTLRKARGEFETALRNTEPAWRPSGDASPANVVQHDPIVTRRVHRGPRAAGTCGIFSGKSASLVGRCTAAGKSAQGKVEGLGPIDTPIPIPPRTRPSMDKPRTSRRCVYESFWRRRHFFPHSALPSGALSICTLPRENARGAWLLQIAVATWGYVSAVFNFLFFMMLIKG
jgi:hypothetical protein